jgi:hypothetical protein
MSWAKSLLVQNGRAGGSRRFVALRRGRYRAGVAFLVAVIVGLAFGAADQYLGSMSWLGPWASTAAQVSAPWLVLPFVAGLTQQRARRAAVLGLVVSASALLGYFAMTYSPMEIHPWSFHRFAAGLVAVTTRGWYNPVYILGGLVTGPLFGFLGQRWRVKRWWVSATIVAGALCMEPLARWAAGQLMGPAPVWRTEVALGIFVAVVFTVTFLAGRRARAAIPTDGSSVNPSS